MTKIKANPIVAGKFWIVEEDGERIGTLSKQEDKSYMYCCNTHTKFYESEKQLTKDVDIEWGIKDAKTETTTDKEVHGFRTSCVPHNSMYDVKRKLPLFTKSKKSKSLYCAGYYIIRFEKGWVRSFCPKLVTIEGYTSKGPFKDELTMRSELSKANADDKRAD
jgi:hypothetical protein